MVLGTPDTNEGSRPICPGQWKPCSFLIKQYFTHVNKANWQEFVIYLFIYFVGRLMNNAWDGIEPHARTRRGPRQKEVRNVRAPGADGIGPVRQWCHHQSQWQWRTPACVAFSCCTQCMMTNTALYTTGFMCQRMPPLQLSSFKALESQNPLLITKTSWEVGSNVSYDMGWSELVWYCHLILSWRGIVIDPSASVKEHRLWYPLWFYFASIKTETWFRMFGKQLNQLCQIWWLKFIFYHLKQVQKDFHFLTQIIFTQDLYSLV